MTDGIMLQISDDGKATLYESTYDITIHCDSEKEQHEVIERLNSMNWIPVSKRLPEEYKYVLLCDRELEPDEDTGYSRMAVGWLEDGKFCCWDDRIARKEFVAWIPLPEPYKEGEHE